MEHPTHRPEEESRQPNELEGISPQEAVLIYIGLLSGPDHQDIPEEHERASLWYAAFESLPSDNPEQAKAVYREFATHRLHAVRAVAAIHIDLLYEIEPELGMEMWANLVRDNDTVVSAQAAETVITAMEQGRLSPEEAAPLVDADIIARGLRRMRWSGELPD